MLYNNTILQDIRLFFPYNSSIIHFLLCLNVILAKQHTKDYNNRKGFTKLISYIKGKIMIKNGGMIKSHTRSIQKAFWTQTETESEIFVESFLN